MMVNLFRIFVFGASLLFAHSICAQTGNASEGRLPYTDNCLVCHGLPPSGGALRGANNSNAINQAINNINQMQFLRGLLTQTQIRDIAAFIANPNVAATSTLSVTRTGSGSGTVSSSPAGISCGSTCSSSYNDGTVVTLTAAPGNGSVFGGWSGACSGTVLTCAVNLDASKSVVADFGQAVQNVSLTINVAGVTAGTVTSSVGGMSCGSMCSATHMMGSTVTLTAVPAVGSAFIGWSGVSGCTTSLTCQVTMSSAMSVTATFGPINYSDMWWGGTTESGWGMAITQHTPSNLQFNAFYVYENNGQPTWYVMPGGQWNSDFTVYAGLLYRPTGSRLDNFVTGNVAVGASVGNALLVFNSASAATFTYTINGVTASKNIIRQPFGSTDNAPGLQVGDLWWGNTPQNGWGFTIAQQFRTLFGVWYTYGTTCSGSNIGCLATWYVMPGGTWGTTPQTANTYTGLLYATTGSAWLGVPFNPAAVVVTEVGTVSIAFTPDTAGATTGRASNAALTYTFTAGPFAGTTQTKQITRQPF